MESEYKQYETGTCQSIYTWLFPEFGKRNAIRSLCRELLSPNAKSNRLHRWSRFTIEQIPGGGLAQWTGQGLRHRTLCTEKNGPADRLGQLHAGSYRIESEWHQPG